METKYFILKKEYGLRSYTDKKYCLIKRLSNIPEFLLRNQYVTLLKCDGQTPLELTDDQYSLVKGCIDECEKGAIELDPWQKEVVYTNRYMPDMNIQLTGKCNYNCLHCFNAVDNAPLNTELTFDEMIDILDQAKACGVLGFTITGGEPMMHKQFIDIMKEIYKRDMIVFELNTNGFFITKEILDEMKSFNMDPLFKISFDGIGYHDWMRNHKGAEEKTIEAFKLLKQEGFKVSAQTNVNKVNIDSMNKTIDFLDSLGLNWIRIIPTTEVPRWTQNAGNKCLSLEEYYDFVVEMSKYIIQKNYQIEIIFWHGVSINTREKKYNFAARDESLYDEKRPLCKGAYEMIAVGASGNVYPCMQAQGTFDATGVYLGNIKKQSLYELITNSDYQKYMTMCIKDKIDYCKECRECEFLKRCGGGCPCISIVTSKDRYKPDLMRCTFFKKGYDLKLVEVLQSYKNVTGSPYKCN